MTSSTSDLKHWQISATVYRDRVEEIHYVTDPARGIRREQRTKVWVVADFLGRGGFGEVHLQRNAEGEGETRAVKRIYTAGANLSDRECEKELSALLEFSKPKVCSEGSVYV